MPLTEDIAARIRRDFPSAEVESKVNLRTKLQQVRDFNQSFDSVV